MNSEAIANSIMELEQDRYPHYLVTEVEIVNFSEDEVDYRVNISSRLDSQYQIESKIRKVKISKLIEFYRDNIIKKILD